LKDKLESLSRPSGYLFREKKKRGRINTRRSTLERQAGKVEHGKQGEPEKCVDRSEQASANSSGFVKKSWVSAVVQETKKTHRTGGKGGDTVMCRVSKKTPPQRKKGKVSLVAARTINRRHEVRGTVNL